MTDSAAQGPVFDCDQHYYEPLDAMTRHMPKDLRARAVQTVTIDGRVKLMMGGKIVESIVNPTFDPIIKAGAMYEYFRGNPRRLPHAEFLKSREPLPDYYRSPEARIEKMDEQGVEKIWLLPTVGMKPEEFLQNDREACAATFRAFNKWLLEDWSFNYKDRIFSSPYLYMADIDNALEQIDWGLENGAVIFVVRPTGVLTDQGWMSPGNPHFDKIWARLEEADVTVIPHYCDVGGVGLDRFMAHHQGMVRAETPPLQIAVGHERPIANYLGAITCDRLFERFPKLRIASVENGAEFLPMLLKGLRRAEAQRPGYFAEHPVQQFKDHVWVSPFWEDDLQEAVDLIGADRILFGSDWPHAEGLVYPRQYDETVAALGDPAAERKIMYENTAGLTRVRETARS